MTDARHDDDPPRSPPADAPGGRDDWLPERSFWQLLPKRTLFKGFWLLLLLGGVFWFRSRSASCAATFTQAVFPPVPPAAPSGTPARLRGEEGRTVRMAPVVVPEPAKSPAPSPGRSAP